MAIVNGYATLAQFKSLKGIKSDDVVDDVLIEELITRASRAIDGITGKWFYATGSTARYYRVPDSRELKLDAALLTVTTLTNGDGTTIASTEYALLPRNRPQKTCIRLHDRSTNVWQIATSTNDDYPITVTGTWGYVSRAATDPESVMIINNTEFACLQMALNWYNERKGQAAGQVQVTGAGVVITPYGAVPKAAYDVISQYIARM